jgi:hypothetical protein
MARSAMRTNLHTLLPSRGLKVKHGLSLIAVKVTALQNTYASKRSSVAVLTKSRWNAARNPEFA